MGELKVYINHAGYSEEDQKQLIGVVTAFKEGKEQPQGRFVILKELPKSS